MSSHRSPAVLAGKGKGKGERDGREREGEREGRERWLPPLKFKSGYALGQSHTQWVFWVLRHPENK